MSNTYINQLIVERLSSDLERQISAVIELNELKAYEAISTLINLLNSPERNVRGLTTKALGKIGHKDLENVAPRILELLKDTDESVKLDAIEALKDLRYKPSIPCIKKIATSTTNELIKIYSFEALSYLCEEEDSEIFNQMIATIEDPEVDKTLATFAARVVGAVGNSESITKIRALILREKFDQVKANLLISSYRLGDREAIYNFFSLLDSSDADNLELLLNVLEDLIVYDLPEISSEDKEEIAIRMNLIMRKFPEMEGFINTLTLKLDNSNIL
jgi:HEAT repeat protein